MTRRISRTRPLVVSIAAGLTCAIGVVACLQQVGGSDDERTGQTAEGLTVSANKSVTGSTYYEYHETAVAFTKAPNGTLNTERWVVGFNAVNTDDAGGSTTYDTVAGWAYSSDQNGTTWTATQQSTGLDFGNPGTCSDGNSFAGWTGDPSLAPVCDTSINNTGKRVLYTSLGSSSAAYDTDAVVAVSDDQGVTWGHAQFVNTVATGGDTDNPVVATHATTPYSTYVAWTRNASTSASTTWINNISYSSTFAFTRGTPQQVPVGTSGVVLHPAIAMGQVASCTGTHEAVYVAWATAGGRCGGGGTSQITPNSWWLATWDTTAGVWYGPWQVESDSNWPNCVNDLTSDRGDNDPRPRLAVEPADKYMWIAHTQSTPARGTRMSIDSGYLACVRGSVALVSNGPPWHSPDPCFNTGGCTVDGGGNGVDGGNVVTDEWGPAIAFIKDTSTMPATTKLLATWYTTREDSSDKLVRVEGVAALGSGAGGLTFGTIFPVAIMGTGQTVPWDHTLATWWDYQGLGVDLTNFAFLGAWGGDARLGAAQAGIWSAKIQ